MFETLTVLSILVALIVWRRLWLVQLNGVGDFDDLDPQATLRYLCECDTFPNVPASYTP